MDGLRLLLLFFIGIALIQAGVTGKLGSMIGAIIDPGAMIETASDEQLLQGGT